MNRYSHVFKTPKGEEEIETRAHKLDRHLRVVLILVDGHSTVEEIEAKGAGMPNVFESLVQLAASGYVTLEGESPAPPPPMSRDAASVKAELIATAKELLGADAEKVVSKLEAAPASKEALLEVAAQCKRLVKLIIDEEKAEELMKRCSEIIKTL